MSLAERLDHDLGLGRAELPRGLWYVYPALGLLTVPAFARNVFALPPTLQARAVIGNVLPFLLVPAMVHALYRWPMPVLLRSGGPRRRIALHLGVSAAGATVVALALYALHEALGWRHAPLSGFVALPITLTWAFVVVSKLVLGWRDRARHHERLQRQAELFAIQSRAHPHFLFNALNTVAALIPEDPARAEQTLERLADVLRYVLETATLDATSLSLDLAIVREYLEIQRARFDHLEFTIDVADGLDDQLTPPLLLLPLVENAVLHGGGGRVSVRVHRTDNGDLALDVENDLGAAGKEPGPGVGLRDLGRRLQLLYGDSARLATSAVQAGRYQASVRLPVTT